LGDRAFGLHFCCADYIRYNEHYTIAKLKTKENNLQTKENILLQQQLLATQTSAMPPNPAQRQVKQ
jgi:hypothetical protein